MFRTGFCTLDQYLRAGDRRRYSGSRASYSLLDVGDHPTEEEIRAFEDISFTLRTSNGTFRTSFRQRFGDIDAAAIRLIDRLWSSETELLVQDRAASHALTSLEFAEQLLARFPRACVEASDLVLYLVRLGRPGGEVWIAEPDGSPLQWAKPPFVVSLRHREPWRFPINHLIAAWAKWRFHRLRLPPNWLELPEIADYRVERISCIHPHARQLSRRDSRFQLRERSVFDSDPASCDVLRTMNIFNKAYFSGEQLAQGALAAFASLRPGGLWIVGRTLEHDFSNHVTFLRRGESGWEVLERIGAGSEMEEFALR